MKILWTAICIALTGCIPNPYARFYNGVPDARILPGYLAQESTLQLYSTDNFPRDVTEHFRYEKGTDGRSHRLPVP